jgi:hypothetical protein
MAKKGSKSLRGQAETRWGETKSAQVKAQVTPTGKRLFLEKIRAFGMSLAEFIERVARGKIKIVVIPDSLKELIDSYDLEKLIEDAGIASERLEEIKNGQTPTLDEKIGLCRALEITHEQLEEAINQHKRKI